MGASKGGRGLRKCVCRDVERLEGMEGRRTRRTRTKPVGLALAALTHSIDNLVRQLRDHRDAYNHRTCYGDGDGQSGSKQCEARARAVYSKTRGCNGIVWGPLLFRLSWIRTFRTGKLSHVWAWVPVVLKSIVWLSATRATLDGWRGAISVPSA